MRLKTAQHFDVVASQFLSDDLRVLRLLKEAPRDFEIADANFFRLWLVYWSRHLRAHGVQCEQYTAPCFIVLFACDASVAFIAGNAVMLLVGAEVKVRNLSCVVVALQAEAAFTLRKEGDLCGMKDVYEINGANETALPNFFFDESLLGRSFPTSTGTAFAAAQSLLLLADARASRRV